MRGMCLTCSADEVDDFVEGGGKLVEIFLIEEYLMLVVRDVRIVSRLTLDNLFAFSDGNVAVAVSALLHVEVVDAFAGFHGL